MNKRALFGLAAICTLLLRSQVSFAHGAADNEAGGLRELMAQSAAVAFGTVIDIQYRTSEPSREEPRGVPHTFVTYAIGEVFRGDLPKTVTLRIPGGADASGGVYFETTAPTFARGETDVLFIKGGEPGDCQLTQCVEGRFRVFEDRIYNGFGVPLVEAEKSLHFGGKPHFELNTMELPRPDFYQVIRQPEVVKWLADNRIDEKGLEDLRKKYELEAPALYRVDLKAEGYTERKDYTGEPEAGPMEEFGEPLSSGEFFTLLERLSLELGNPEGKVVAADPKLPFTVRPPVAAKVPEIAVKVPRASDEEINDRKRLAAQ